jgi:asparagine synthase (glutamine-hydrolysing)
LIGGYILFSREYEFEEICRKHSRAPLKEFAFEACGYTAWFFHNLNKQRSLTNIYHDEHNLLFVDGLAVTGDSDIGYRFFNPSNDFSLNSKEAFSSCINKIVSNISAIFINHSPQEITVNFSSSRAAGGRIWFLHPRNMKGIILCDDFRPLAMFSDSEIEIEAIYSILQYSVSPDPISIIKNIYCVPQSHFGACTSKNFKVTFKPYFRFDFPENNNCNLLPSKNTLQQSLDFLKSSDPLLLLSGGVDSTLLACYLGHDNGITACFLSFKENNQELVFAESAAKNTGVKLNTIRMKENDILPSIKKIASAYVYPFVESATIPSYYLLNQIRNIFGDECVVIDGTGADSGFGTEIFKYSYVYRLACYQPMISKKICQVLYQNLGIYNWKSKVEDLMRLLALSDRDVRLTTSRGYPLDPFFNQEIREVIEHVDSTFVDLYTSCMEPKQYNESFYPEVTLASFTTYVRANLLNTYRVGHEPAIEVVYPYLWKDILIEQGKLSWNCRHKKGINKWPLKKLLEEYLPYEFVYRKKSGFYPPLNRWLDQEDIGSLAYDLLLDGRSYISAIISRKQVSKMINDLSRVKQPPHNMKFLWGAMFIEMWLQENFKQLSISK